MDANFNWVQWASDFGYTNDEDGISALQKMYGLPETGVLDDMTVKVVTRLPRCGMTDAPRAGTGISKWGIQEITYCIQSYPTASGLTTSQIDLIVAQAFAAWMAVVDLRFTNVKDPSQANILIGSARGARNQFDGPSGTLAWCQLPPSSSYKGQLRMMFDGDENWTQSRTANGIIMLNVATHELGHGLGLDHNNVQHQLMNPYYDAQIAAPQSYDQQDILRRYPAAKAAPKPTPAPIPSPSPGGSQERLVKVQWDDGTVWGGSLSRIK